MKKYLILVSTFFAANMTILSGQSHELIRVTCSTEKKIYKLGEQIRVHVEVVNVSDKTIGFVNRFPTTPGAILILKDKKKINLPEYALLMVTPAETAREDVVILAPKKTWKGKFELMTGAKNRHPLQEEISMVMKEPYFIGSFTTVFGFSELGIFKCQVIIQDLIEDDLILSNKAKIYKVADTQSNIFDIEIGDVQ
jgi:hypothetical protein